LTPIGFAPGHRQLHDPLIGLRDRNANDPADADDGKPAAKPVVNQALTYGPARGKLPQGHVTPRIAYP